MAKVRNQRRVLSDEELSQLVGLVKKVDSVELKATVPADDQRAAITSLELDPIEAQIRQVFFFDTPDLTLDRHGVVVRARRVQGGTGDTVVKLRPVEPADLPTTVRKSQWFGVEVDAMPGGYVCSGSMKGVVDPAHVNHAARGNRSIRKLFSKEQRAFFAMHAPEGVELDDLSVLGPIFVLKLKRVPEGFARKLTAEMWLYPDNSRVLELSTKCKPTEAFQVAAQARAFLTEKGIDLGAEQQTKTRTALDLLVKSL
ncbi:MAG TPA: hypothetical protein VFQ28_06805 [Gaiella sp.]|nr:hypothetical protein [Gaiella sp.]